MRRARWRRRSTGGLGAEPGTRSSTSLTHPGLLDGVDAPPPDAAARAAPRRRVPRARARRRRPLQHRQRRARERCAAWVVGGRAASCSMEREVPRRRRRSPGESWREPLTPARRRRRRVASSRAASAPTGRAPTASRGCSATCVQPPHLPRTSTAPGEETSADAPVTCRDRPRYSVPIDSTCQPGHSRPPHCQAVDHAHGQPTPSAPAQEPPAPQAAGRTRRSGVAASPARARARDGARHAPPVGERVRFTVSGAERRGAGRGLAGAARSTAAATAAGSRCAAPAPARTARRRCAVRWPRSYYNGDERVRWTPGAKADVIVFGDGSRDRRRAREAALAPPAAPA